jgi:hypothetical protein
MRIIGFLILFLVIGFAVGYLIYGIVNNEYVHPLSFFAAREDLPEKIQAIFFNLEGKRQNILVSTAIGGVVGLFLGAITKKKK